MSLLYELRKFKASRDAMRARRLRRLSKRRTRRVYRPVDRVVGQQRIETSRTLMYHSGFDKAERRRFQAQLSMSIQRTYGTVSDKDEKVIADTWRNFAELRWKTEENVRELAANIEELEQRLRGEIAALEKNMVRLVEQSQQQLRSEVQAMMSDTLNRLIPTGFIENPMKFILGFITGDWIWNLVMGFLDTLAGEYYAAHSKEEG